jgi:IPT/TIG domain
MKNGCDPSDIINDQQREDKLIHVMEGKYYGHPNPKRAAHDNDPRQCVWRNPTEPTSSQFQAPLGVLESSAAGIIEYRADHFNRQLRWNLIHVKYKNPLRRTVLTNGGTSVHPLTVPGISITGRLGLDVTQAPNGNLFEVRFLQNSIWVNRPIESISSTLRIHSIFPYRGGVAGGTRLSIYGINFVASTTSSSSLPTVTVGGRDCPLVSTSTPTNTFIECTVPGGTQGLVDVIVTTSSSNSTTSSSSYTFEKGYRYITGF